MVAFEVLQMLNCSNAWFKCDPCNCIGLLPFYHDSQVATTALVMHDMKDKVIHHEHALYCSELPLHRRGGQGEGVRHFPRIGDESSERSQSHRGSKKQDFNRMRGVNCREKTTDRHIFNNNMALPFVSLH